VKTDIALPMTGPADPRPAARQAERDGYAALWTTEVKHDPFIALALAASVTERAELGTGIAVAFARSPMTVAVAANDLQALSGGRLLLGLGSQVRAHVTHRFSMPWSQPAARMREFILALRAIWASWQDGTRLSFRGDFYTHTVMTPFFSPGRNPFGPPRVLLAGVGPGMTRVAGEVADGFLVHGFTTERYLREVTVPALDAGRAQAGAGRAGFEISGSPLVAVGRTEAELAAARQGVREQLAFYGSTPAYRPVLDLHGWGELGDELHRLSRRGQWAEMTAAIGDDVLDAFAVSGAPGRIAPALLERYGDLMTRMTLYTPYDLDPAVGQEIAADLRGSGVR
jgi:probable F420-dependent oxidoreductase